MNPTLNLGEISELERRKKVRVRLRPDLDLAPHKYEGKTFYVVKDPVSLRYYRFKEHERFLLDYMDGAKTLDDAQKAFEQRFRPERLTLEDLEAFTSQLLQAGLAQNENAGAGKQLFTRYKKRRNRKIMQTFMNVLYIKIPVFDPDRVLEKMKPVFGFIFTQLFLWISIAIMLGAVLLVATHWSTFISKMPAYHEFFTLKTMAYLWVALGLVKIIHEFGHGLSCKTFGGEVHEMGLLFLVFSPCMYCNVSDAWTLPSKWQRIVISAAGIYVELIIAAIATFVWWSTDNGTFANNMSMSLMVVCSISTFVFNANPLMRFDGYYVLADWLEIPNLREKANKYLGEVVQETCLGIEVPPQPYMTMSRKVLFVTFAIVSWLYRWIVTFSVLGFMYSFLEPYKLGSISYLFGTMSLGAMIGMPLYKLGKSIHRRGRLPDMKPVRVVITAAIVVAVLSTIMLIPFPMRVKATALIQADPQYVRTVVIEDEGNFLAELLVKDGEEVKAGQPLARFNNVDLSINYELTLKQIPLIKKQIESLIQQQQSSGNRIGPLGQQLVKAQGELDKLEHSRQLLRKQQERLVLRAPIDGTVMKLIPREQLGNLIPRGSELCSVGDETKLRAVFLVQPADKHLIEENDEAFVRIHGRDYNYWKGHITSIANKETNEIPHQLSTKYGGDVATETKQAEGEQRQIERPQSQHFMVTVDLDEFDKSIHPGVMGRVKVVVAPRTLAWRFYRYLNSSLNWRL
ncbi:MAG TPA: HlyD family efflux transporter periplasmic adaptor subunit [Gemmatales bacterium]|nr:HlyD family efflux transporter periplasmic adaptor subunit [Gemmatales bacterium]